MQSLPEPRFCANGARCVGFDPHTDKPTKLSRYTRGNVCNPCQEAESHEDFESARRLPTVTYWTIQSGDYPLKAQLAILKRNLVAQMLGAPGSFREAVHEVRNRWRIYDPPARLPPPSEEGQYPGPTGLDEKTVLHELYVMWSHHPHLPPITWGTRSPSGEIGHVTTWPTDRRTAYANLARRWELDLGHALFLGGAPEEHLYVNAPLRRVRLPWLRFAAACVLYNPPVEEATVFADYGGLPALPGEEGEEEPLLGVLTARQRIEPEKYHQVHEAAEKFIQEKMWECRRELPDDYSKAHFEVLERHGAELMALQDQVLGRFEEEMELNPPSGPYHIEFSPEKDRDRDVLKRLRAIRSREGLAPRPPHGAASKQPGSSRSGSPAAARGDNLLPVMCALLLQRPGLTRDWLADKLGLGVNRIKQLEKEGCNLLKACRP